MAFVQFRRCHYAACGFNPEYNSVCARIRKTYGPCPSPCTGPCYLVSDLNSACAQSHWGKRCQQVQSLI